MADVQAERPVERAGWPEQRTAQVGEVIEHGPIPGNVVEVRDRDDDLLVVNSLGHWHSPEGAAAETCDTSPDVVCGVDPMEYVPLTVTRVREEHSAPAASVSGLCGVGPDRVNCIVAAPDHRRIYHGGRPAPNAKLQRADASALLDLVQEYADDRVLFALDMPNLSPRELERRQAAGRVLYARIAALVPEMSVQARHINGGLWWIRERCGRVWLDPERPAPSDCRSCGRSEAWRPLLVGGTPAPEPKCPSCGSPNPEEHPTIQLDYDGAGSRDEDGEHVIICTNPFHGKQPDLIAQVMAELGVDRPEDVMAAILKRTAAFVLLERSHERRTKQRDEARAALARYTDDDGSPLPTDAELDVQIGDYKALTGRLARERDEARAAIERMTGENGDLRGEIKRLGEVARAELGDARAEVEHHRNAAHNLRLVLDDERAAAAAELSGPLVLTLPEVPEGAVALVGVESGRRYARGIDSTGETSWAQGIIGGSLGEVLDGEPAGVTVEMAPPREPRTWPKLDEPRDLADVIEVEGHGRFHIAVRRELGNTTYVHEDDIDEHGVQRGLAWTLGRLRELGTVTEVLDEPGGAR